MKRILLIALLFTGLSFSLPPWTQKNEELHEAIFTNDPNKVAQLLIEGAHPEAIDPSLERNAADQVWNTLLESYLLTGEVSPEAKRIYRLIIENKHVKPTKDVPASASDIQEIERLVHQEPFEVESTQVIEEQIPASPAGELPSTASAPEISDYL
jgi:hypothetical protein